MMTTAAERRTAVQVAKRLRDPSEPPILDHGELDLLCRTLLDCLEFGEMPKGEPHGAQ